MALTNNASAALSATVAENAAAEAKSYAIKASQAEDFSNQAQASAESAAASAISSQNSAVAAEEAMNIALEQTIATIRVPDGETLSVLPVANERKGKFPGFDPVTGDVQLIDISSTDAASLALSLASTEGSTLVGTPSGTVEERFSSIELGLDGKASNDVVATKISGDVTFATGGTLFSEKDFIYNSENFSWYFWSGSFSGSGKVVPPGSTPEDTGGVGPSKWVNIGDAALRGDLAKPTGAAMIGGLGYITPEMYGAKGGLNDDRVAFQLAFDAIASGTVPKTLFVGGEYFVSLNPSSPSVTNAYAAGSVAISIKSPCVITGGGRVKLLGGEGSGKEGAIFGNPNVTTLTDVTFNSIDIDGNHDNTAGKISGILMVGTTRLTVNSGVYVHDLSNHGIMSRPNAAQSTGYGPIDTLYDNPRVERVGGIGVQATRPDGFILNGGRVRDTGDNGWDVYGNNGSDANGSSARRVSINNPQMTNCLTGGFMESFTDATITGDYYNCNGLKLNRIISGARRARISAKFSNYGYEKEGLSYGISIQNASGYSMIDGCEFDSVLCSLLTGSGTIEVQMTSNNLHRDVRTYIIKHGYATNSIVRCHFADQIYAGNLSPNGWPQMAPPADHPWYVGSRYQSTVGNLYLLTNHTLVKPNFSRDYSGVLTSPSSWSGAFSLYNFGSDGKTRIVPSVNIDVTNYPIVIIAGQAYELSPSGTGGQYYVAQWDGTSVAFGDFTAALNSAISVDLKFDGFKTPFYSDLVSTATYTMASVSGWGGYTTFSGGETLIYLPGATLSANTKVVINSYSYWLTSSGTAGTYYARRISKATALPGDWTKNLNAAHIVFVQA